MPPTREELKARLMAEAEEAIDELVGQANEKEDLTLSAAMYVRQSPGAPTPKADAVSTVRSSMNTLTGSMLIEILKPTTRPCENGSYGRSRCSARPNSGSV